MTRFASALPLLAIAMSAPLAAQEARDFQLPPAPTASPDNRVQGPVDPDAPVPVRPRAIETARPTPTPAPSATSAPAIVLPAPAPAREGAQPRVQSVRPNPGSPSQPSTTPPVTATAQLGPQFPLATPTAAESPPAAGPQVVSSPTARQDAPKEAERPWLLIALGSIVAVAGVGFVAWRRRTLPAPPPEIIAPTVPAAPKSELREALAIAVEAMRMERSFLNATVGYRVTVRNRTSQALTALAVEADLVSASRERPAEQQLASPKQSLTPRHAAERLAPGQSLRFEGQVRLPISEANAIWQGRVGLLVPLLRVRATAADTTPVASTLVIGRTEGSSARPQPFRLDEPPRSYAPLAQRVLDGVPVGA